MNRRDFLKRSTLATAGVLVGAEAIHDFLAWQNRRIFALGGWGPQAYEVSDYPSLQHAVRIAHGGDTIFIRDRIAVPGGMTTLWGQMSNRRLTDGKVVVTGMDHRPSDECAPDNHWLIYGNALHRDLITKDERIGPWPKHITIGLPT